MRTFQIQFVFFVLQRGTQIHIISILNGLSVSEDESVLLNASAVRALAIFILFPSLREGIAVIFISFGTYLLFILLLYRRLFH